MTQSVCAECGEASPSGAQFCPACGHFLWTAPAAVDDRPVEDWWTETPSAERREAERREAEQREVERREAERRKAERQAEQHAAEQREAEQQAAAKLAAERQAAERQAEQQAAEQRAAERRAAERQAAEQRAAEQQAAEARQVENARVETAAPTEAPVRLRLEPSALRTDDSAVAELHVVVDNRAGSRDRRVRLVGRDPEQRIRFTFGASELWVPPHTERAAPVQVHAPMPPPGEQADRTFTVTVHDGPHEIESAGHWVQRTGSAPISTATIHLDPEEVRLRDRADAYLSVLVDNRRSDRPLRLRLSGDDPESAVQFTFQPPVLDVGPGHTGRADIRVVAPLAPYGEETVRTLRVRAGDENGDLEATGVLRQYTSPVPPPVGLGQVGVAEVRVSAPRPDGGPTVTRPFGVGGGRGSVEAAESPVQSAGDGRTVWRVALTVLGAVLVAVGCFRDWLVDDPDVLLPGVSTIPVSIGRAAEAGLPGSAQEAADLLRTLQPVERTLTLLLAAAMVFGLTGRRGGLTRTSGMVVALTMVAGALFWRFTGLALADGVLMVAVGGAVGVVGGLFVRR